MSAFDQALEYVTGTLARRQATGLSGGRADLAALHALAEAAGGARPYRASPSSPAEAPATARAPGSGQVRSRFASIRETLGASSPRITPPSPTPEAPRASADRPVPEVPAPRTASPAAAATGELSREERMAELRERVAACVKCPSLAASRTQTVFGVGHLHAELMFVGEAPGADEDRAGEPFVGRAGQLLTKIIEAMRFRRDEVFIANVLKCRPDMPPGSTGNRKPTGGEMATCLPYLIEQIGIIQPKCLVALGATAMEGLTGTTEPMRVLRGRWHAFKGIPLMATYHPAYLLRNQSNAEKRKVWEDMLQVLELLGKPITPKMRSYFLSRE